MSDQSRRNFLKTASIGAAAVGATAAIGFGATDAQAAPATAGGKPAVTGPAHDGPFTVWVKDASTGTIAVLVGEQEVVHHDPELATTLARLAARGAKA